MARHFVMNFCPKCRKSVAQSLILDITSPKTRWTVKCQHGAIIHVTGTDGIDRLVFMIGYSKQPCDEVRP